MTKVVLLLVAAVTLLQGCVSGVAERDGTSVDITPIHHTLKVSSQPEMSEKVENFVSTHWQAIAHNGMTISYSGDKRQARKLQDALIRQGIAADAIRLENEALGRFTMMLEVVEYRTQVEFCQYPRIGDFGAEPYGCFVQNARWQSMTHPHRNLPNAEAQR
ncbi:hypothetical protein [Vibrio paucivorans]